jgi:hypothetical protein
MDRHLQQKLEQFTATPPEGAWNKIVSALDTESDYATRLSQYEAAPPANVWKAVEAGLEKESTPAKVIPFGTRFRRPMRYAAVASFIAVVLVTITLTVKRTEAGSIEAGSETTVPANKKTSISTLPTTDNHSPSAVTTTTQTRSSNTQPHLNHEEESGDSATVTTNNRSTANTEKPIYASANGYVVFSDGDGKLRKVSKKLVDFVTCHDNDLKCKQRLQQLRQKMAASVMTTDFTGLVESLRQLQ